MARVIAALICLGLAGADASAQRDLRLENLRSDQTANDLGRYHAILDAYIAGDEARSVEVVARAEWDEERLRRLSARLDSLSDPRAPWDRRRYSAAAMVHVDAAIRLSGENITAASLVHLDFASNLFRRGLREHGEAMRLFAEHWYVAVASWLRYHSALRQAETVLRTARERLPDNPGILFASGTLAELLATDYAAAQSAAAHDTTRGWYFPLGPVTNERNGNLGTAAGWLRRASALAPDTLLVRLHLGRVLALREDDEEALRLLEDVQDRSTDDAIAYLASLFIGGLRVRQGRLENAAAAFQAAIERFPRGHAAYVGLSEALQRSGKGDQSRDVLMTLLGERRGTTREPMWWYVIDPPAIVDERFELLRREVRK